MTREEAEKHVASRFGLTEKPKAGSQIAVMALAIWDELVDEYMARCTSINLISELQDRITELESVHSLSNARRIISQQEAKIEELQDRIAGLESELTDVYQYLKTGELPKEPDNGT